MAASNATPLPSCKPSRNGMPASRRTPVRSPNGKMMPEPGRYSRARKLAAWAVQARRASELTSDSFHDIEDGPPNPQTPVIARARIILVFAWKRARYQSHKSSRGERCERDRRDRVTRVVPAIGRQVRDEDGRARGVHAPDVEQGREQQQEQRPTRHVSATATNVPAIPRINSGHPATQRDAAK